MIKHTLFTAFWLGLLAGIAFIIAQPFFGMSTLTSRHAAAYINGGYVETTALMLSWFVHLSVSIFYALLSYLTYRVNQSVLANLSQMFAFGWLTTLLATPANQWVVELINSRAIPGFAHLAPFNTDIGPKFWLHVLFFAFVIAQIYLMQYLKSRAKTAVNTPALAS